MDITTDYLIIGAGATGLAFADSLLTEADAELVLVDRRQNVGGHWRDAYPFVRLHTPSAYYGVNSMPLGRDRLIESGRNEGFYEQAGSEEICDYFDAVAGERFESTGRAQFLAGHEYLGGNGTDHQVRDLATGDVHAVRVRRKVVDACYLESSIPATHQPSFTVAPEASFVPVNALPEVAESHRRFTIIGSGKTSADACLWLLDHDVEPDQIRWIRPRDAWFSDRAALQPLDQVAGIMEGISLDAQAAAETSNLTERFEHLESSGRHLRLDPGVWPTMFRATMLSRRELADLQDVEDVVRLGRVQSIGAERIVLDDGEVPTGSDVLHVDCSAKGLRDMAPVPVFAPGQIVLQQVRHASPPFNAAFLAFLETHRDHDTDKNRLSRPNPHPSRIEDWGPMMRRTWTSELAWSKEPDLASWVAASRLNLLRGLPEHADEPRAQEAITRFLTHVGPALERLGADAAG